MTWATLFKAHSNVPRVFHNSGSALLPVGSMVHPVFARDDFDPVSITYCEVATATVRHWIISARMVAEPVNLTFDTSNTSIVGKRISEYVELSSLILVPLWTPKMNALQGRTYIGFLLSVQDLKPY